jgi:hypothetical protein
MHHAIKLIHDIASASDGLVRRDLAHVLTAVHHAMRESSDESDAALLALMKPGRAIHLTSSSIVPHAMPPAELVKLLLVQYFLRKDPEAYRHHVEHLRDDARPGTFRRMIQGHLDRASG